MDFTKLIDKAIDSIEKTVANQVEKAATLVVDEFPDRTKVVGDGAKVVVTTAGVAKARNACVSWADIDLEGRKPEWEVLCEQIKHYQADQNANVTPQQWQQRAKDAEYKLYQTCSLLLSVPDPTPFLENVSALQSKILEVENANRQLQAEADSAHKDMQEITALVEKHQKLEAAYKELQEQVQKKEAELKDVETAAAEALQAKQEVATQAAEIAKLQASLKTLRDDYEKAQSSLFELVSSQEAAQGSRQADLDMAHGEVERLSQRVTELEMEKESMAGRLAAAQAAANAVGDGLADAAAASHRAADEFWERQLALKADQVAGLQAQLEAAAKAAADLAVRHETQIAQMSNQLASAELSIDKLQKEVGRRPEPKEWAEVRQRCEALQSLVDLQMEAEGWGQQQIKDIMRTMSPPVVQNVLQERNRKLSSEVSTLRRELGDKARQVEELGASLAASQQLLSQRQDLIHKLEDDLLRTSAGVPDRSKSGSQASLAVAGSSEALSSMAAQAQGQGQAQGPGGLPGEASVAPQAPGTPDGAGGLLEIVVSQRDRFRLRVTQLEEEKSHLSDELDKTRRMLEEARADNVSLYEKVRYLERFSQKASSGQGRHTVLRVDEAGVPQPVEDAKASRYQCGPLALEFGRQDALGPLGPGPQGMRSRSRTGNPRGQPGGMLACFGDDGAGDEESGGPEAKYSKAYEARVNPFAEFQQGEIQDRVKAMQLHDRAMLAGSKLMLGSRVARAFIAIYAVLLHLFIMVLLYYSL